MNLKENNQKNRNFFNQKINEYDKTHEKYMNTKNEITKHLNDNINKILDLGAGTGLELIELFKKYPEAKVTAIDISENMLEKLKERPFSKNVTTICSDFFEINYQEEYDAAISTSALHHFTYADKKILYQKIYKSLKQNGIFLNSDKIVLTNEEEKLALNYYEENKNIKPHIDTPLSIEHEIELLNDIGFKNIIVEEVETKDYRLFIAYKK